MNPIDLSGATFAVTLAGFVAGTTTTTTITNNTTYCINGKAYTKTAASNAATPTTDAATGVAFKPVPANHGSIYVFGLDLSGNIKVVQGEVTSLDPAAGTFIDAPEFPIIPDTVCPYGYLVIKAASTYVATTTGWLIGTHNMSSVTGITYTFVDILALPNRPQVS